MIVDAREEGLGGPPAPAAPPALALPNVIPATSARREISFICASEARAMSPSG